MSANVPGLSPKQWQAVELLARGESQAATAKQVKSSPKTIQRWYANPDFEAAVHSIRWQLLHASVGKAIAANVAAIEALEAIATNPTAPESARVSAAAKLLDHASKGIQYFQVEATMRELQTRLDQIIWTQFHEN